MRHILGLVIPEFDFNEKLHKKLKVDYLVITSMVKEFEKQGDSAGVYFAVMNTQIGIHLREAIRALQDQGHVSIQFLWPDEKDFEDKYPILSEKTKAMGGIIVLDLSEVAEKDPEKLIKFGMAVGKQCIHRQVNRLEAGVQEVENRFEIPAGVDWDYYGTVDSKY